MIFLKADNRLLVRDGKKTYLSNNTASSVSSITVISSSGFSADDYLIIGNFGDETSEIVKISSITNDTTIALSSNTKFAHPESTNITKIPYNTVRYYITTTTTFSAGTPLGTLDVNAQNIFTTYEDSTNGSGYGWFIFINSTSGNNSAPSNPIPYGDFDDNSVYKIIESFLSSIDGKDNNQIKHEDLFRWIREGYSMVINELNLVNKEFQVDSAQSYSVTSGTAEYALPSLFSSLISITDSDGLSLVYCKPEEVQFYKENGDADSPRYYLRGEYIGFTPTPTSSNTYTMVYLKKSPYISSYYDNVVLPNNNFFCLNDFLMYKSSPKLGLSFQQADGYYQKFLKSIESMKLNSFKQNNNQSSFGIDPSANI